MGKTFKKALRDYWRTYKGMLVPFGMCAVLVAAPSLARWGIYLPLVADAVDRTHMGEIDPAYGPGATALGIVSMWIGTIVGALITFHAVYEIAVSIYYQRQRQARRDAGFRLSLRSSR